MPITETFVQAGSARIPGYVLETITQLSTNSDTLVAGTLLDVSPFDLMSISLKAATNAITFTVQGANFSDFSDASSLYGGSIAAGASAHFTPSGTGKIITRFVRVLIRSTVAAAHGTASVAMVFKRSRP